MLSARRLLASLAVCGVILWFLSLPVIDILAFPQRLSVLPNLETDAAAYDAFARDLAASWDAAALPAKHPPGWMVVLASVYSVVGHSYVAGKLISFTALVAIVGLCGWLADRVYGRTAGVIAALLSASSPGLRAYVGTLQYEVLTGALFAGFLALSMRAAGAPTRRAAVTRAGLAGLVGAVLVLTRETFVLVVPLAAMWLWLQQRHTKTGAGLMPALVLVVVAALPALAWSAVQSAQHRRVILIADKAREVFDAGNNPLANGTYNEPLVGIGQPAGFAYIREYPAGAIGLAGRKLLYSFGILRDGWNVPHPAAVWIWRATTGALPLRMIEPAVRGGWLLALCIAAVYVLGRDGLRRWWVLPASVCAILAVHLVTLASYRFTIPLLPVLYVLASGPLAHVARATARALRSPVIGAAAALIVIIAVAAQFQRWPLHVEYDAVDLEGLAAANAIDPVAGTPVRTADAGRGERPVALLPDTYLPRGPLRVTTRLRRTSPAAQNTTPVARISFVPLDARAPCVADVSAAQLPTDHFTDIAMLCTLERDGPATIAVTSLGQADLAIQEIRLSWVAESR